MSLKIGKIGVGYSSDRQSEVNRCIHTEENSLSLIGSPESMLTFNGMNSYSEVVRELNVDLTTHARIDLKIHSIDENSSIQYSQYVKETDYSKSFIFNIRALFPSKRLNVEKYGIAALTKEAAQIYRNSTKEFLKVCGDQFIAQESFGASLYISTKLDFLTKFEKDSFDIDSNWILGPVMNFLRLGVGNSLNKFFQDNRASLSIAVLQLGGDATYLQREIPELGLNDNGLGILDCFKYDDNNISEKLDICKGIMNNLLGYASHIFPSSFNDLQLIQVLNTYKLNYKTIGIKLDSTQAPEAIVGIRNHLKELYQKYTSNQQFLIKLLQPAPNNKYMNKGDIGVGWDPKFIPGKFLSELIGMNNTLSYAIKTIKDQDTVCFDRIDQCSDFNEDIDLRLINTFNQSYIIKSKCSEILYGPRYILPIGNDLYREDSIFRENNSTQTIVANYSIISSTKGDNITITLNDNASCSKVFKRDAGYNLIYAYNDYFDGECAKVICPDNIIENLNRAEVEFILIETPI